MEDTAALVGLAVALLGVLLSNVLHATWLDAAASLVIGGILCVVAALLASQTHGLLIGKSATREDRDRARKIIESSPHVERLVEMLSLHLGPNDILLAIKVGFDPAISVPALEDAINEMERRLRAEMPTLKRIFVEPDSKGDEMPSVGTIVPPEPSSPSGTGGGGAQATGSSGSA
jgi:divalent metal cation (Fe/Co/Zn/Cd) transporter